jgi:uncharacterized protein (DUF924 family)
MQPQSILHFWFIELTPKDHFAKDAALDEAIHTRFAATLEAAARCELFAWRATPEGRLVEVSESKQSLLAQCGRALDEAHDPQAASGLVRSLMSIEKFESELTDRLGKNDI